MENEVRDSDDLKHEECLSTNEVQSKSPPSIDQPDLPTSSEEEDDSGSGSYNEGQHLINEIVETKQAEIKQEPQNEGLSDNMKQDNQDADEEEEVGVKDEEPDKTETEKSSPNPDNQEGCQEDNTTNLGRNRRVRQKNRYFEDFLCTDLTKGARSNRDDYDTYTSSFSTRSSNRRSTTDSKGAQEEPDVFENKYCRKCLNKTPHDLDSGCQACLYKKIVESSKRQKPSSQKNRSASSKQQHHNEIESSASSQNTTNNKRKATKQHGGATKSSNNIINNNGLINSNNISDHTNINDNINSTNTGPTNRGLVNNINDTVDTNDKGSDKEIGNKLPKLDSWTPDEVAEYIISKGFTNEAELFKTQSVDGISLLLMQRTDFTYGLKIKLGPALKIYDQVCKLKKEYFSNVMATTN